MNWRALWRTLTEPEQVGEMRRLRAEEAWTEKARLRPHHILCNGDPRSPVEGCRWCDGPKGLWAEARKYHQTVPPSPVRDSELWDEYGAVFPNDR